MLRLILKNVRASPDTRKSCVLSGAAIFGVMAHLAWMRRYLAAIALVLFGMGSVEDVFARHWCPHHDGPLAVQSESDAGHSASGVGHGASDAGHGASGVGHGARDVQALHGSAAAHGDASGDSEAHGCTCVGDCAGTPGTSLPVASAELQQVQSFAARSIEPANEALIARQRPPHFLPWSNGPPTLV